MILSVVVLCCFATTGVCTRREASATILHSTILQNNYKIEGHSFFKDHRLFVVEPPQPQLCIQLRQTEQRRRNKNNA